MTDPAKRPSRRAWPLYVQDATTPAGTHSHRLPRWLLPTLAAFGAALVVLAVVLLLMVQHQQSLTKFRTQQNKQIQQDMQQGFCDLLDQLPQSAVLDGPRKKYGCGPGIPVDQLPPSIRQRWGDATTSAPTASSSPSASSSAAPLAASSAGGAGSSSNPSPTPATVPPRPSDAPPSPMPTPSPTDPLLCGLVPHVCQEAP